MTRLYRVAALVAALLVFLPLAILAGDSNLKPDKQTFQLTPVSASGTGTTDSFTDIGFGQAKDVSAQFRGVGTSPNYKVEILVSLDQVNFVKPEVGGDLGTFTDQNYHVVAITVPFCQQAKLKFTELGGANSVTPDGVVCAQ